MLWRLPLPGPAWANGVWVTEIRIGVSGNEGGKDLCGEPVVPSFRPISLAPDFLGSRLQKSLSLYTLFILCILSLPTQQLLFWAPHFPIVFSRWTFLYRKTPGTLSPAIWNMT